MTIARRKTRTCTIFRTSSSMKQIHIPGDWAAPIAFVLVAAGTFLRELAVSAEYAFPGEKFISLAFLVVAALLSVAAVRGRSVEDSATYYYSDGKPTAFVFVAFGAGFLFMGALSLLFALQEKDFAALIWALILNLGFLWLAHMCLLKVQIVVFNTDKTFLTMQGKPWSFTRRYKVSDFSSLSMGVEYAASTGINASARRLYCTYTTSEGKKVLLLRDTSIEKAQETVKNITRLTGLKLVDGEPK